jgi:hypothetical protein
MADQVERGSNIGSAAANPRAPQPNPKDPNLPQESTGPIAADSLAAESVRSGGAFAKNRDAQPMDVKGGSSALNTTDTSGAKVLEPAPSAQEREGDEKAKYPEGIGKPQFPGHHHHDGYVGGRSHDRAPDQSSGSVEYSTTDQDSLGGETGHTLGEQNRAHSAADQAPMAFGNFQAKETLKPKGNNLKEGDFPQTSTHIGDVGGPHDPGRVAEEKILSRNADTSAGGAGGARQYETNHGTRQDDGMKTEEAGNQHEMVGSTGQFDVLDSEEAHNQGLS